MAERVEHIPELKGIDVEIFLKNLERDITEEEIKAVRNWALGMETIWYKFDPFLTAVCIQLLKKLEEYQIPKGEKGFNKCWLFQQLLFFISKDLEKKGKKLGISYGWFRDGVVVDPEVIVIKTRGKIMFKWEDDCPGCQIENECPCIGNPHNNKLIELMTKFKDINCV